MSINRVILVGRLTRDPELRTTTSGKSVVGFSLAVDRRGRRDDEGGDADFFRITAWERTADFVANYCSKGRLVAVEGRLQSRKFQDKDGNNREVVEVVADNVQALGPRGEGSGGGEGGQRGGGQSAPPADDFDPFADN